MKAAHRVTKSGWTAISDGRPIDEFYKSPSRDLTAMPHPMKSTPKETHRL